MDPALYFPKFRIYDHELLESCPGVKTEMNRSCVRASLKMSRKFSFYMTRFYAPTILIVAATFIGFWLPITAWPARVSVVLTPFLSLITMHNSINSEIRVSYVVAIHIWMFFCMFFTFMGLIEYSFVLIHDQNHKKKVVKQMRELNEKLEEERIRKKNINNLSAIEEEDHFVPVQFMDQTSIKIEKDDTKPEAKDREIPRTVSKYLRRWWRPNDLGTEKVKVNSDNKMRMISMASHQTLNPTVLRDYEERNGIDKAARIIFPALFLFFIIGYFAAFMPSWLTR